MNIKIYKMTLDDLNLIRNILLSDFDNFWNYDILKQELASDNSFFIIAKDNDNNVLGFAGFKAILDEADIMNIVVKKAFRNNGIGSLLLENLIAYAKNNNIVSINLEVNENNFIAISLYKKYGFESIGIRKKYYNNIDNAILMNKKI